MAILKRKITVQAEAKFEESSGNPESQDVESTAHTEVPENKYSEASAHPGFIVVGSSNVINTHKTPEYVMTLDVDVENIDLNNNNTYSPFYDAINAPYFGDN